MILTENYSIIQEDSNNTTLVFTEDRVRKDKEGEDVIYIHKEKWYFVSLQQALKKYLNKVAFDTTATNILKRIKEVEDLILTIK